MNTQTQVIVTKLDELAEIQAALEIARLDYNQKRDEILAQVRDQLNALDTELQPGMNVATKRIASLSDEIKALVRIGGTSVKAAYLRAVYTKGRTTWNTKELDGFAVAYPEIMAFRKVGEPSVVIRSAK